MDSKANNTRGRKRLNNEASTSQAEREQKEKNRLATQKCRQKKEQKNKELKQENDNLEKENEEIFEEKQTLKKQAQEYMNLIKFHENFKCEVPANVLEQIKIVMTIIHKNENSSEEDSNKAVESEGNHPSFPTIPERIVSENVSLKSQNLCEMSEVNSSDAQALFSGTPLTNAETTQNKSSTSYRTLSSSSSPTPSARIISKSSDKLKDLSYFLTSKQVPEALAPVCHTKHTGHQETGPIPLGRIDLVTHSLLNNNMSENAADATGVGYSNGYNKIINTSHNGETILQFETVSSQNKVDKDISREYGNDGTEMQMTSNEFQNIQNTPSPMFAMESLNGYSYSEDLQQQHSTNQSSLKHNGTDQNGMKVFSSQTRTASSQSPTKYTCNMKLAANAIAPALLDICPEMSESLQQQLQTSYSISPSSGTGDISLTNFTNESQYMRQNTGTMQSRPDQISKIFSQQQEWKVGAEPLIKQAMQTEIRCSKDRLTMIYQSSNLLPGNGIDKSIQEVLQPALLLTEQPYQFNQTYPQLFQTQTSGLVPQNVHLATRLNQGQHIPAASIVNQTYKTVPVQQPINTYTLQLGNMSSNSALLQGEIVTGMIVPFDSNSNEVSSQPQLQNFQECTDVSYSEQNELYNNSGANISVPQLDYPIQQHSDNMQLTTDSQIVNTDVFLSSVADISQSFTSELDGFFYNSESNNENVDYLSYLYE